MVDKSRRQNGGKTAEAERLSAELWARYSDNFARHIIALSTFSQSRIMQILSEEKAYDGLRLSFEPYIGYLTNASQPGGVDIEDGALRPSSVAEHLGISRQVCNQTLNQLEQHGYIRRKPDPLDGRAKLVSLTAKGRRLAIDGQQALVSVTQELRAAFARESESPDDALHDFSGCLQQVAQVLALYDDAASVARWNTEQVIGAVLPRLSQHINKSLMSHNYDCGHQGLTLAHGQVLNLIGPQGGRVQTIAELQGVSKQAISAIAQDLEQLGYLRREASGDSRSRLLQFTAQGVALIRDAIEGIDLLESALIEGLAQHSIAQAEQWLQRFKALSFSAYSGLALERDVFTTALDREPDLQQLAEQLTRQLGEQGASALAKLLPAEA